MLQHKNLIAATVAACLMAPVVHATDGYFALGYGTKSKGMAGTGVAMPQDSMAAAINPAGMVFVGDRFDVGAAIFSPRRQYKAGDVPNLPEDPSLGPLGGTAAPGFPLEPGTKKSGSNWFLIPHFGWNKALDESSSFGVTIYGNGGMNTDYNRGTVSPERDLAVSRFIDALSDPSDPFAAFSGQTQNACSGNGGGVYCGGRSGIDLSQLFINLSYSRKIANDRTSIGGGLILAGQAFEARGLSFFSGFTETAVLGGNPKNLTNNGHDTSFGAGVKVGIQSEVTPGLTLGASYQSKIWMSKFNDYKDLFAEGGDLDIPPTATVGLSWKAAPQHTINLDFQYIWYESVAAMSNKNQLGTRCSPLNLAQFDPSYCLGGNNGAGFGWDNMGVIKLGWQYDYSPSMAFRAGYSYGNQPISGSQVLFNTLAPGVVEQHITAGLTQKLSKESEWSMSAMYAPEKTVKGPNAFTGDPNFGIPSQDIKIKMSQFEVEASYGRTWD
jgi:long-chain fatty acid transport protein